MKRKKLEQCIKDIESQRGDPSHTYGIEVVTNEQAKLNKLYIRLINDFNESINRYNCLLICLTSSIAILNIVMIIK